MSVADAVGPELTLVDQPKDALLGHAEPLSWSSLRPRAHALGSHRRI